MNRKIECPVYSLTGDNKIVDVWNEYTFFLCSNCDVIFCSPRTNPGREWYENSLIHSVISNFLLNQVFWYHKQFLNDPNIYGKTLLDVGCGTGNFLNLAQKTYVVWGVDFNRVSINISKERFGLKNVFADDLDGFINVNKNLKFDVVTFFEVLEHQDSPAEFILKIKKLLSPNGYVAISVPNRNSYLNPLSEADKPPNHLIWWNEKSLRYFLEKNGFEVIKLYSRILDSEGLADAIENKLRFAFGKYVFRTDYSAGNKKMIQSFVFVADLLLRIILKPTNLVLKMFSLQGSNLYALARLK